MKDLSVGDRPSGPKEIPKRWPRTYRCPRCGDELVAFLDLAAGRCSCGGAFSLRPRRKR